MEVPLMYDLATREQSPLALRREVEQQLARSREGMQYTLEQTRVALDMISDITLAGQEKVLATDYIALLMLESAARHGCLLPDTHETILAMRQQYQQFAGQTQALACSAVLQDLYHALAEGVPEEETNPIIRFFQGR